jgi:hypothetical protein
LQTSFVAHFVPHAPQLFASVFVLEQTAPHLISSGRQVSGPESTPVSGGGVPVSAFGTPVSVGVGVVESCPPSGLGAAASSSPHPVMLAAPTISDTADTYARRTARPVRMRASVPETRRP